MRSYTAYKGQIQGIKNVSETVKTVEKIAASSVHFLKSEVANLNIYATHLEETLVRLSLFYKKKDNLLLKNPKSGKKTIIILTSDKGLVGGLWHGVVNSFLESTEQYQSIIVTGTKGENYLKEEDILILKSFTNFIDIPQKDEIKNIMKYIFEEFKNGSFSQVDILYPKFVSLASQTPTLVQFIPFNFKMEKDKKNGNGIPIFEPSQHVTFDNVLRKYIEVFFYKIFMETKLSELSARTVAMEHATTKTKELIHKLTLDYTKDRRRIVTQRQLESFTAHKII